MFKNVWRSNNSLNRRNINFIKGQKFFSIGLIVAIFSGLLLASPASAQPKAIQIPVTLHEFKVEMPSTSFPVNKPLHFIFSNTGVVEHEAVLEKAGADDEALEFNGESAEVEHIQPGETKDATWTITEPGDYQIACHTPGHYEGGMVTRFTVSPPAAAFLGIPVISWVLVVSIILVVAIVIAILNTRRIVKGKGAGQPAGTP